jgi:hypothetical protein
MTFQVGRCKSGKKTVLMTVVPCRNLLQLLLVVDQDIGRHARKLSILENRE